MRSIDHLCEGVLTPAVLKDYFGAHNLLSQERVHLLQRLYRGLVGELGLSRDALENAMKARRLDDLLHATFQQYQVQAKVPASRLFQDYTVFLEHKLRIQL